MNGIELIAQERQRQIDVEGWTPDHDDEHQNGALSMAAGCYAFSAGVTIQGKPTNNARYLGTPQQWPWQESWWKPDFNNPVHDLVRAGALIAAEIDRLQRLEQAEAAALESVEAVSNLAAQEQQP